MLSGPDGLPAHPYVPGGPWPRPAERTEAVEPIAGDDWRGSPAFVSGVDLFRAGYYWEAHEAWEALWHAHGRRGPVADLLKGLIKLAAAGVKVRQGQPRGVVIHAGRAAASLASAREHAGRHLLGLDLDRLIREARAVESAPPVDREGAVFGFEVAGP